MSNKQCCRGSVRCTNLANFPNLNLNLRFGGSGSGVHRVRTGFGWLKYTKVDVIGKFNQIIHMHPCLIFCFQMAVLVCCLNPCISPKCSSPRQLLFSWRIKRFSIAKESCVLTETSSTQNKHINTAKLLEMLYNLALVIFLV